MEVEEYLSQFNQATLERLTKMRDLVREIAPSAKESISYGIIGYKIDNKPLVYFGGYDKHVGLYATPNGHDKFKEEFKQYKQGKGSVQFPHDKPLPEKLIKDVIKYRVDNLT